MKEKNLIRGIGFTQDMYVRRNAGKLQFHFFGMDPRCFLQLKQSLAGGWYRFTAPYLPETDTLQQPKLYFDHGRGYFEELSLELIKCGNSLVKTFFLPQKTVGIRFDPTTGSPGVAAFQGLALTRITLPEIIKRIYRSIAPVNRTRFDILSFLIAIKLFLTKGKSITENLLCSEDYPVDPFNYQKWIRENDSYGPAEIAGFREQQDQFPLRPLISILMPVYNTPPAWLQECIESVRAQVYDRWELCIADDASSNPALGEMFRHYTTLDQRIKVVTRDKTGGIAACSNTALRMANGDFSCLLDHDDLLSPMALYRIAACLNDNPETDFFYSDEDKIDDKGERVLPFFKPDWSPALLYSQNYITHLACIRTALFHRVNGFSEDVNGSQDYDLFLKLAALNVSIRHIPHVLYHWRMHPASTSQGAAAKPYAHEAGKRALQRALKRIYPTQFLFMENGAHPFTYLPRFELPPESMVSIIIPTRDKLSLLQPCVNSILHNNGRMAVEIIIVDNQSVEPATHAWFNKISSQTPRVRIVRADFPFNWSRLNNLGADHANGQFLIFLNNDTEVISADWTERLCEYAALPDTALVGCSLLYEDGTLQHNGVVVGMNGWADHVFKSMRPVHFPAPFVSNEVPRNVLALTGACMAIEAVKFEWLGKFDESFTVCGSDVELCIRAHKKNFFNVLLPHVRLYHYESKSRGSSVPENDFIQSAIKYEPYRTQTTDPFFNPNLSLHQTTPVCK